MDHQALRLLRWPSQVPFCNKRTERRGGRRLPATIIVKMIRFSHSSESAEGGGVAFPPRRKPGAWRRRLDARCPVEGWGWGGVVPSVCVSASVEEKGSLSCMICPPGEALVVLRKGGQRRRGDV